jgi:hypothetical protein
MAMDLLRTALIASAAAAVGLGSVGALAETSWIMASGYPEDNFHTKNIRMFIEEWRRRPAASCRSSCTPTTR